MGLHGLLAETFALPEQQGSGQSGRTGVDVNGGAPGEVQGVNTIGVNGAQPTRAEDPVGDGIVDQK